MLMPFCEQVRRSRQLEISFVATVVNYEYKFIWTLSQVMLRCAIAWLAGTCTHAAEHTVKSDQHCYCRTAALASTSS
jgi:Cu2+-containing amine oxidase